MKRFVISERVFRTDALFVMNCSHDELNHYLKRHYHCDAGDYDGQIGQMFTFDRSPYRVVWIEDTRHLGVVLHEVYHLVTRILYDKGVHVVSRYDDGTLGDETAAYLYEFYAVRVLKRLGLKFLTAKGV